MPPTQRDKTVNNWLEILWGKVPLEGLLPSYREAAGKHKDGPFRPGHIIAEWDGMKANLPAIQTECLFCPGMNQNGMTVIGSCPFHGQKEVTH